MFLSNRIDVHKVRQILLRLSEAPEDHQATGAEVIPGAFIF